MDPANGWLDVLITATPQLGQLGVLVLVLGLLLRREHQSNERHAAELLRVNEARNNELRQLRDQVTELQTRLDEVNRKLDEERAARRRAEDAVGFGPAASAVVVVPPAAPSEEAS